ncbi:NUDIX hydrolase [Leifsonia soli]
MREDRDVNGDEWWDVVDADGVSTGERFMRGAPEWPDGAFHLIVATCVVRLDGSVLLTQRAPGKEFGYGWEFPGGSVLAGETSRTAASRELREETGIAVIPDALILVARFVEASALLDLYVAEAPSSHQLHLQATEVMAAAWVTITEVERRLDAQVMASPWNTRLAALWPKTKTTILGAL